MSFVPHSMTPELLEKLRREMMVGYQRWRALSPKCCALTQQGVRCRHVAMAGSVHCYQHAGRRGASLRPPQNERKAIARQHAALMRRVWAIDAWAEGFSVRLNDEGERLFAAWLQVNGLDNMLPDKLLDWARWRLRNLALKHAGDAGIVFAGPGHRLADVLKTRLAEMGPPRESFCNLREQSERDCWRVGMSTGKAWHDKAARRGAAVAAEHRPGRGQVAAEWRPVLGTVQLSADERMALAHAAERDLIAGGSRHVELARRQIDEARRAAQPVSIR